MNVNMLNQAIETLKEDLGEGLLATDIFTVRDGMSVGGFNPQPKASALFNLLATNIMKTLKGAGFPNLNKYVMMDLEDDKMVIIIPMDDYRWGILVDTSKIQLGLLVSIAIPNGIENAKKALA